MPEIGGSNVEIAHRLNEAGKSTARHSSRFEEVVEIIEAVVLALVAIATAWSGYQAARLSRRNCMANHRDFESQPKVLLLSPAKSVFMTEQPSIPG